MTIVTEIEINNACADNDVEVTLRGDITKVMNVLIGGLGREALQQLSDAMSAELAKSSDEAQSPKS